MAGCEITSKSNSGFGMEGSFGWSHRWQSGEFEMPEIRT